MDTVLPKSNKTDAQSQELNIENPNTDGRFAASGDKRAGSNNSLRLTERSKDSFKHLYIFNRCTHKIKQTLLLD